MQTQTEIVEFQMMFLLVFNIKQHTVLFIHFLQHLTISTFEDT